MPFLGTNVDLQSKPTIVKHRIEVKYQLATDPEEVVNVPVRYKLTDDGELCIKILHCEVDLPETNVPGWLMPRSFQIINHYKAGMHIIHYNDLDVSNMDAEFFRYKLYADIMLKERLKEGVGMEHC